MKSEMLTLRLPNMLIAQINAKAKDEGISRSELVRRILVSETSRHNVSGEVKLVTREEMEA